MDRIQQDFHKHIELLNLAATTAMQPRFGAAAEAYRYYTQAMELASPIDTTMIGHAVYTLVNQAAVREGQEPMLQIFFAQYHAQLIPGSTLVPLIKDNANIPDFTVEVNGDAIPVEIKDHPVGKAELRQIERYAQALSITGRGYIVAPSVSVALPEHITFVSIDYTTRRRILDQTQEDTNV